MTWTYKPDISAECLEWQFQWALLLQWTAYNDRNGTYVPSIGEVYHTIMKRGYEINPGEN